MNKRNPLLDITKKTFRQSINEDRFVYYGIAILLVVLCHLYCQTGLGIVAPFSKGAIGVDIFLFFSGYALCYSYEKNTLKEYYWRRFKKILPIFCVNLFFLDLNIYSGSRAKLLGLMGLSVFLGSVLFFWRQVPYMYWLIYALVCPLLLYVLYMVVANRYLLAISMIRRS